MSEMRVGGSVYLRGPCEFRAIDIGGSLRVDGDLLVERELRAGGSVRVEGSLRAGVVRVGGSLSVSGRLEAGEVHMGGSMRVGEGAAWRLEVGGSLEARVFYAGEARIGGSFTGVLVARRVVVGRKSRIRGTLVAEELVVGRDAEVEEAYAVEAELERGAEARVLGCIRCRLSRKAWVGRLLYVESFEDKGGEVDEAERVPALPQLERLRELEEALARAPRP